MKMKREILFENDRSDRTNNVLFIVEKYKDGYWCTFGIDHLEDNVYDDDLYLDFEYEEQSGLGTTEQEAIIKAFTEFGKHVAENYKNRVWASAEEDRRIKEQEEEEKKWEEESMK